MRGWPLTSLQWLRGGKDVTHAVLAAMDPRGYPDPQTLNPSGPMY